MSTVPTRGRVLILTGGVLLASLAWLAASPLGLPQAQAKGKGALKSKPKTERHPAIRRAERELREAKGHLEKAAHDFGGHRVAAIKDIDKALHQLRVALKFDSPKRRATVPPVKSTAPTATPGIPAAGKPKAAPGTEKHPQIHKALHKLHQAKRTLENAAHDFGGHRVDAIKDIDRAINQLKQALAYDKK